MLSIGINFLLLIALYLKVLINRIKSYSFKRIVISIDNNNKFNKN